MSYIQEAFHKVCEDAKQTENWYVCLMEKSPFYGGPEEGGWQGEDHLLHAYKEFPSEEIANRVKQEVEKLAKEMTEEARKQYGQHCLQQMEWLDARMLDADYLTEPDGPSEFYVMVTQEIPQNHYGNRQWS